MAGQTNAIRKESFRQRFFQRLRKLTEWKADGTPRNYFTPQPHIWWQDLPRLTRGKTQHLLIEYAWRMTAGLERDPKAPAPEKTPLLAWRDLAELFHCSVQEVKDDAKDAAVRGLVAIETPTGGVTIQVLWKAWEGLPDYKAPRPVLVKTESKPEKERPLFDPFDVRRGSRCSSLPLPPDVNGYRFEVSDGLDSFRVAPLVKSGKLVFKIGSTETKELEDKSHKSTDTRKRGDAAVTKSEPVTNQVALSVPKPVAHECARWGFVDDGAIVQLIVDCQSYAPECTMEEIAAEIRRVCETAPPKIKDLSYRIKEQVPKWFASTAYRDGIKPQARKSGDGWITPDIDEKGARMIDRLNRMRGLK
jgi:hypothetical protein